VYARPQHARETARVTPLDDGEYDCIVVDVARNSDAVVVVDVAISRGEHKGEVVQLRTTLNDEPLEWLGVPGSLRVVNGAPEFRLDDS
jgi:hypothetical protein